MFNVLVLILVLGMGSTVVAFAQRSLRDEAYQRRFTVVGAALVGTGAVLATTSNLVILAIAWVATSLLAVELIRTGPAAGVAERSLRARRSFVAGDLALVAAVAIIVVASGSTAIGDIDQVGPVALGIASVLVVIAAAARSASGPFYRWLPDSLGAPTPSSALLHAGVVNGGALVLLKLAPTTTQSMAGAVAAALVGGLTCVFAEAVMVTRPDVKGRLAWSTIAQMSFTLLLVGLGLHIAAGLHLVAHGLYKGALFLGSGSTVRVLARVRRAPSTTTLGSGRTVAALSFGSMAIAIATTVELTGANWTADLALVAGLAWVAAGCATQAALRRATGTIEYATTLALGAGFVGSFLLGTVVLKHGVESQLGAENAALSPLWVLPVLASLVAVALAPRSLPVWRHVRAAGRPTPISRPQRSSLLAFHPGHIAIEGDQPALDRIGA